MFLRITFFAIQRKILINYCEGFFRNLFWGLLKFKLYADSGDIKTNILYQFDVNLLDKNDFLSTNGSFATSVSCAEL